MYHPDYVGAREYALRRLERELSPELTYHSLFHTRDDVLPAIDRLAAGEGVGGEDLALLCTAAAFHDIGFVERTINHEIVGIRIVGEVLPQFHFSWPQIQIVMDIILATRLPQTPFTLLERIMADADLDVLGREDYWVRNQHLRSELESLGKVATDVEWHENQLEFLSAHHYFTATACATRDGKKSKHIAELESRCMQAAAVPARLMSRAART